MSIELQNLRVQIMILIVKNCRNASIHKKILKSFQRIGMCLNSKSTLTIPNNGDLDKNMFCCN